MKDKFLKINSEYLPKIIGFLFIAAGLGINEHTLITFSPDHNFGQNIKFSIMVFQIILLISGIMLMFMHSMLRSFVLNIFEFEGKDYKRFNWQKDFSINEFLNSGHNKVIHVPIWLVLFTAGLTIFYVYWELSWIVYKNWDQDTNLYSYNNAFLGLFELSKDYPQWNPYILSGNYLNANQPFQFSLSRLVSLVVNDGVWGLFLSRIFIMVAGSVSLLVFLRSVGLKTFPCILSILLFLEFQLCWMSLEAIPTCAAAVLIYATFYYSTRPRIIALYISSLMLGIALNSNVIHAFIVIPLLQGLLALFMRERINIRRYIFAMVFTWVIGFLLAFPTLASLMAEAGISQKVESWFSKDFTFTSDNFLQIISWYIHNAYGFKLSAGMYIIYSLSLGIPILYWESLNQISKAFVKSGYVVLITLSLFYFFKEYLQFLPVIGKTIAAFNPMRPIVIGQFCVTVLLGISFNVLLQKNINSRLSNWNLLYFSIVFIIFFICQRFGYFFSNKPFSHILFFIIEIPLISLIYILLFFKIKYSYRFYLVLLIGCILCFTWLATGSRYYTSGFPDKLNPFQLDTAQLSIFPDEKETTARKLESFLKTKTKEDFSLTAELRDTPIGDNLFQRYPSLQIPTIHGFADLRSYRSHLLYLWMLDDVRRNYPENYDYLTHFGGFANNYKSTYENAMLDLAGVRYLIGDYEYNNERFIPVMEGEKNIIFENMNAFPRAFMVNNYQVFETADDIGHHLRNASKAQLKNTVALLKDDISGATNILDKIKSSGGNLDKSKVKILNFSANEVILETISEEFSLLVLTQNYHKGWKVDINGFSGELYPAYFGYMGVPLPEGKNIVRFTFSDRNFVFGVYVSIFTLCIMFVFAVIKIIKWRFVLQNN